VVGQRGAGQAHREQLLPVPPGRVQGVLLQGGCGGSMPRETISPSRPVLSFQAAVLEVGAVVLWAVLLLPRREVQNVSNWKNESANTPRVFSDNMMRIKTEF
jgi:hypothetical protein